MDNHIDTFFLNLEEALKEAKKQNIITTGNNQQRLQYCYYQGYLTNVPLENFIHVPQNDFVNFFSNNHLPIPDLLVLENGEYVDLKKQHADIIKEIKTHREQLVCLNSIHKDTYFLDPLIALNTAKQKNRVSCGHPTIDGLQACYYHGAILEHNLENLIHVDLGNFVQFFSKSALRPPLNCSISNQFDVATKQKIQKVFQESHKAIADSRNHNIIRLAEQAKLIEPDFQNDRPIRVFVQTSRLTQVMQYSARGIAKALEKMGYEIFFQIEENEMESHNGATVLQNHVDFKPHITVNINHVHNRYLNQGVINIIWFQDLMPALTEPDSEILKRTRDIYYLIHYSLNSHIENKGIFNYEHQTLCIDEDIFKPNHQINKKHQVVFIGSAYHPLIAPQTINNKVYRQIYQEYCNALIEGELLDKQFALKLMDKYSVQLETFYPLFASAAIRDTTIEWLCQCSFVKVKIYGRYWNDNPITAPYYAGEVEHGEPLAKIYQESMYAISCQREEITNQRLLEIAACDCMPIVYDAREAAESPHWDNECLFFKTQAELYKCLENKPKASPVSIAEKNTYSHFARRLDKKINAIIKQN